MGYVGKRAAPYLGPLGGALTGTLRALRLEKLLRTRYMPLTFGFRF